ncbi:MAG: hypothetical protein AB7S44_02250 [Spirochaetales bacterium]
MEEVNFNKIIGKTAVITLVSILILIIGSLGLITLFSPVTLARFTSSLGLDNASIFYYELAYNKSDDINDLYNLLNKTIAVSNEEKIITNFELLYDNGSTNYYAFIDYINTFNLASTTNNSLRLYLTNEDARLKGRYVLALARKGETTSALDFAIEDLASEQIENIYMPINFIINAYLGELIAQNADSSIYNALRSYEYMSLNIDMITVCFDYYDIAKAVYDNDINLTAGAEERFQMAVFANGLIKIASTLKTISTKITCPLTEQQLQTDINSYYEDIQSLII